MFLFSMSHSFTEWPLSKNMFVLTKVRTNSTHTVQTEHTFPAVCKICLQYIGVLYSSSRFPPFMSLTPFLHFFLASLLSTPTDSSNTWHAKHLMHHMSVSLVNPVFKEFTHSSWWAITLGSNLNHLSITDQSVEKKIWLNLSEPSLTPGCKSCQLIKSCNVKSVTKTRNLWDQSTRQVNQKQCWATTTTIVWPHAYYVLVQILAGAFCENNSQVLWLPSKVQLGLVRMTGNSKLAVRLSARCLVCFRVAQWQTGHLSLRES